MSAQLEFVLTIGFCVIIICTFYLGYLAGKSEKSRIKSEESKKVLGKMVGEKPSKEDKTEDNATIKKDQITFDNVYEKFGPYLFDGKK